MLRSIPPRAAAAAPSTTDLRMLARSATKVLSSFLPSSFKSNAFPLFRLPRIHFSSKSPYPFYYELISYTPAPRPARRRRGLTPVPQAANHSDAEEELDAASPSPADKAKRKYYRKLEKRMYGGSDSDDERARAADEEPVELQPDVIEFRTLHSREEELFFHDTFAMPWEKDKHYRMVYQLEKKYFPDQCLDKAFEDPEPAGAPVTPVVTGTESKGFKGGRSGAGRKDGEGRDEKGLIFFDEERGNVEKDNAHTGLGAASERKVEELFKSFKKVPSRKGMTGGEVDPKTSIPTEPFLSSRKTGLPPRWDGPSGTVVLIDKPKGWTSFTVCGKLRRVVKVQKVGHAGTLDPMATGLLIVCVGKATKLIERYQGMVKGYSGIFRLGEATSTWDADSPVIQREPWEHIKDDEIRKAAASFCGETWQVPPMFSAIKVGGERMYDKARRGEMVELSPRRISIFRFDIERSLDDSISQAKFDLQSHLLQRNIHSLIVC